ncbi:hypothetical protein EV421DRAFT_43649 [Armillaria borealis]|uniref:Uncharacterized protein n=1 Tax=Armillaria borealis TaxID=47425 RepID=A0AA39N3V9_9AGAR|nr:hypothetical protein EV421DRAFT_43649 [Armillaria borealis]
MYHVPSKSSNSVRCVGPENQRCSQRHGFFAVCDVDLFVNNGAENIGCSLDRDRCQCDAYYYYYYYYYQVSDWSPTESQQPFPTTHTYHLFSQQTQKSSIYRPFLSKSTRSITCHVNLLKSNSDSAMFPYLVFCHLPNFAGFRKCFPDIQYIHLETKLLPEPYCGPWKLSHRLIRTRVSIKLDQATTQLGDLPIDCVFEMSWMTFLCEVICDMTQYSWMLRYMFDTSTHFSAVKSSTCSGSARSFHGRACCEERSKDLWGINHRFQKAGRTSTSFKTFFSDLYDELCRDDFREVKLPLWKRTFGVDRTLDRRSFFTTKHGSVVLL